MLISKKLIFRLVTDVTESAITKLLTEAIPNSIFNNVYRKNMDKNSYQKIPDGLNSILKNSKTAMFHDSLALKDSQEYINCQVV